MAESQDQQEANKRAAQQIYDVWDGGDENVLDDVIAEDVVFDKPDHLGMVHQPASPYSQGEYGKCSVPMAPGL